jgi:glycosyltransferase involved in cell wall biosynthesis
VIPAFREARLIGTALARLPTFVDTVIVVDDASDDGTSEVAGSVDDPRVLVLRHSENRGVGAAIGTGYRAALERGAEVIAVMAGDNQMDPADLERVVEPVCAGDADYVKGNRLEHPRAKDMPWQRRLGSRTLAGLTRLATGLDVGDTQCGYTALSASMARRLPLDDLWPRFGYPNDLLGLLAASDARVVEVPVRPVYADEQSGLHAWHMLTIAAVIARRKWRRARPLGDRGSFASYAP